jgi:hypothetical protein
MIDDEVEIEAQRVVIMFSEGNVYAIRVFGATWKKQLRVEKSALPVEKICNKKRKKYYRTPKENVWRCSKKYGTTITNQEKENILNQVIRTPGITSKQIQSATTIPMHKVLATSSLLKEDKTILRAYDSKNGTIYTFQP